MRSAGVSTSILLLVVLVICHTATRPGTDAAAAGSARPLADINEGLLLREATIRQVHDSMLQGNLTCSRLVQAYLRRIAALDKTTDPEVNAIRVVNPAVLGEAAARDAELRQLRMNGSSLPALFCVPMLIKDSIDVMRTASTAGSMSLTDNFPAADASAVRGLKRYGAVILAKTNMAEFAWTPFETRGSLFGVVRNPYDTTRTPGGSSGGSAAAVAASFGLAALGTDTGDSTRGPASHCACVGLRPTIGRTSRAGIVPARLNRDSVGVITRSVEDAARVLGALCGVDAADPQTQLVANQTQPNDWTYFLDPRGLFGARIGVLRAFGDAADDAVAPLFRTAMRDLQAMGATLVDFRITGNALGADWGGSGAVSRGGDAATLARGRWSAGNGTWESLWACQASFREDVDAYLANASAANPELRYKTLQAIVEGGGVDPSIAEGLVAAAQSNYSAAAFPPPWLKREGLRCGCLEYWQDACRAEFRKNQVRSMDRAGVQAIIHPTWGAPPQRIRDITQPEDDAAKNYSPSVAPHTGAPAITVPMGFTRDGLPTGLQFLARPWDEANLLKFGFAYEQHTRHRHPPSLHEVVRPPPTAAAASSQAAAQVADSGR